MQREAHTIRPDERLDAEIAVVGAGPIGIVLALQLAEGGRKVALIESGSERFDAETQKLSEEETGHSDYFHAPKEYAVRRQVGGTSALWGGRCVPFDPIDFEARPAQPEDLWPVSYDEIKPYLGAACEWCVCGRPDFNAREIPRLASKDLVPGLPDDVVRTTDLERWSLPTRFGPLYRKQLATHPNIDLITGLTCTEIVCNDSGTSVDHLLLKTLSGVSATLRADRYVLATGGLEATRLLLASNSSHPDGIGNHSGHLGRWYMAHVEGRVAEIHLTTPPEQTIYSHERDADGVYVRRRFTIAREYQERHTVLNSAVWIVNPELGDHTHGSGILSGVYLTLISPIGRFMLAEAIRKAGTKTTRPTTVRAHLKNIVRDLVPAAIFAVTFTYERFLKPGRKAPGFFVGSASNIYPLQYHGEHLPHWESRVELSEERDALGLPRLRTTMHFDDRDVGNVRATLDLIDRHLRAHGVGEIRYLTDDVEGAVRSYLEGTAGYHQTGTTRMSREPDDGVVDANLHVHGVNNLAVAATSVFPTSSQANPTFMGIAFALRLADQLERQLRLPERERAA